MDIIECFAICDAIGWLHDNRFDTGINRNCVWGLPDYNHTNLQEYEKQNAKKLQLKKLFYNQTEILNRQSLPLQQNYKKKVQEYFKETVKD